MVLHFNTWKAKLMNILEEHDLGGFVYIVVAEPKYNARHNTFKKNQAKVKKIIYNVMNDNLMYMITSLNG